MSEKRHTYTHRSMHALSLLSKMIIQNSFFPEALGLHLFRLSSSLLIRTYKCLLKYVILVRVCVDLITYVCLRKYQQLCPIMISVTLIPWDSVQIYERVASVTEGLTETKGDVNNDVLLTVFRGTAGRR